MLDDDECKRILAVIQRDFELRQQESRRISEFERCSSDWFYAQTRQKYKRCGSAKIVRDLYKREKEILLFMPSLIEKSEILPDDDNIPKTFLTILQELHQDGRLASWKVRGQGDILSVKLTWTSTAGNEDESSITNAYQIKATAQQRDPKTPLSCLLHDKNSKIELREFSDRIRSLTDKLQNDLAGRNENIDTRSQIKRTDKQKLTVKQNLKEHQQHIAAEIGRARVLLSETTRSANIKNDTYEHDLRSLIIKQIEYVLQTDLSKFQKTAPYKPHQQLFQPSDPIWSEQSPQESTWEIKSRNDSIRKVIVTPSRNEQESMDNYQSESEIRLDPDSETDSVAINQTSFDSDTEIIPVNEPALDTGNWKKDWQLAGKNHIGEEVPRNSRIGSETVLLTIPEAREDISPRIGDKSLEELGDDDLYADDQSNIHTMSSTQTQDISTNDDSHKTFSLSANLILSSKRSSSNSYRQPSYTYESDDNESVISEISSLTLTDSKMYIDEEKFKSDPHILDPKFIQRPKDLIIRCGEAAKFKCQTTGTEPIDVFWFRFGADDDLVNDEKYQITHDENYHYLKIYATTKEDEGNYLCVLANDKAQNVDIIRLIITDNKRTFRSPTIIQDFKDVDVIEGSLFTLRCKIDHGYPKARVLWYREDKIIRPDGHYKLYYDGDGVHVLQVDESTTEEDNSTFTFLVFNAAGRVHISADVFVNEKEVIDRPRGTHIRPLLSATTKHNGTGNMISNDEDRQTNWSASMLTTSPNVKQPTQFDHPPQISPESSPRLLTPEPKRHISTSNLDRSAKLLESWKNLYQQSIDILKSDDLVPFHPYPRPLDDLEHESPREEHSRSPTLNLNSNQLYKSKWEVRLPELLNVTVGPDRPKRNPLRRHTTEVVYKQPQEDYFQEQSISNERSIQPQNQSLSQSFSPDGEPPSPLVKHLKQRFDKIEPSKVHRVASLTCRGLTANKKSNKRPQLFVAVHRARKCALSDSTNPLTSRQSSLRKKGNKNSSLPNTYRNLYPPQSTKTVVNQLLKQDGFGAATVVYDSTTPNTNGLNATTDHRSAAIMNSNRNTSNNNMVSSPKSTRQNNETSLGKQPLQPALRLKSKENINSKTKTNFDDQARHVRSQNDKSSPETIIPKSNMTPKISNERRTNKNLNKSLTTSNSMSDIKQHSINPPAKPERLFIPSNESTTTDSVTKTTPSNTTADNVVYEAIPPNIDDARSSVLARAKLWDKRISVENGEEEDLVPTEWSKEFEQTQENNVEFCI
ncbi:unnamed protein product [Didymodactylos carnosus]|nr:unnamed protein product [Didymodactylos carnosus]CAF3644498.1 unnamed protein product [Didymodactylos carnosus]